MYIIRSITFVYLTLIQQWLEDGFVVSAMPHNFSGTALHKNRELRVARDVSLWCWPWLMCYDKWRQDMEKINALMGPLRGESIVFM